jgi:hAT family C-terminal dimerisation region
MKIDRTESKFFLRVADPLPFPLPLCAASTGLGGVLDALFRAHNVATASRALATVRASLADPMMVHKMLVAKMMTASLVKLIFSSSADSINLQPGVISAALNVGSIMATYAAEPYTVREAVSANINYVKKRDGTVNAEMGMSAADVALLDGWIKAGATAAMTKQHHIEEMSHCLRRRNMYDWRINHSDDFSSLQEHGVRRTAEWFGAAPAAWAENSVEIMAEYKRWATTIELYDDDVRASMNSSLEWLKNKDKYPLIYNMARWHCAISTASTAVERVFAIMRAMEASNRLSMQEESFQYELFFRCNKWIVDIVWARILAGMPRSSAAALAASEVTRAGAEGEEGINVE